MRFTAPGKSTLTSQSPSNTDTPLQRAKARLTIPALWQALNLPGVPKRSCRSPFREDRTASFSIHGDGTRWRDFATGEHGDAVDFLARAAHLSPGDAIQRFLTLAGEANERNSLGKLVRSPRSDAELRAAKRAAWPLLESCTSRELAHIAEQRGLSVEGVTLAAERGLLWCADSREGRVWVLTDARRRNAQARLLSGQRWAHGMKARTLPGSEAAWPIGLREAEGFSIIAWCEGGPDLLAACHLAWCEGLEDRFAPVAMLGATVVIPQDALASVRGWRIRVYPHLDKAGYKGAGHWVRQLLAAGAQVDGFAFSDLYRADGRLVNDLNDLVHLDPDTWESERDYTNHLFPQINQNQNR